MFISLAAVCFLLANYILLGGECGNYWIPIHVFTSTLFVYQLSRWTYHRKSFNPKINRDAIYRWLDNNESFTRWSIIFSGLVAGISFLFLSRYIQAVVVVLGVVSVLYPLPILPFEKIKRLRDIPLVKVLLIAFVWSGQAVLLPAIDMYGAPHWFTNQVAFLWMSQFVFILFITIPFDIKDMHVDSVTGVTTLPSMLGEQFSKHVIALLGIAYVFMLNNSSLHLEKLYIAALSVLIFSLVVRTYFLKREMSKWRVMLIYDGSMIWYYVFLILIGLLI